MSLKNYRIQKILAGVRVRTSVTMPDMARQLQLTSAELSAVETGRTPLTLHLFGQIKDLNLLNHEEELRLAELVV